MVLRLKFCVAFFTTFYLNYTSCEDKELHFEIFLDRGNKICKRDQVLPDLKLGDKFQVSVSLRDNLEIRDVARCSKSQASKDLVQTEFKRNEYSFLSVSKTPVTQPVNWNYTCRFYTQECKFNEQDACTFEYAGWKGYPIEDFGVNCTTVIHTQNAVTGSGYLTAHSVRYSLPREYIYTFQQGDAIFTCHKTTGTFVKLVHSFNGEKTVKYSRWASSVTLEMELAASQNHSTLDCVIGGDGTDLIIRLRFIFEESMEALADDGGRRLQAPGWAWVAGCGAALLIVAGLAVLYTCRKKKQAFENNSTNVSFQHLAANRAEVRQSNHTNEYSYAEPYSLGNHYTGEPTNSPHAQREHTYLNNQLLSEPTYPFVRNSEPDYFGRNEPTYASVHKTEPNPVVYYNPQ